MKLRGLADITATMVLRHWKQDETRGMRYGYHIAQQSSYAAMMADPEWKAEWKAESLWKANRPV